MFLINNFRLICIYYISYYAIVNEDSLYLQIISTYKTEFNEVTLKFTVPSCSLVCHINSIVLYYTIHLLLISNDIHPNPGPRSCILYSDFLKFHALNKDNRKYVHINFQNMQCKSYQFKDFLESTHDNNTIYGFTETWLTEDDPKDPWTHDKTNLECFRRDRQKETKKTKGGGIQLLVPTHLNPVVRPDLLTDLKNIEMTAVEIDATPGSLYERIVICLVYNPNKKHKDELIQNLNFFLERISLENKEILILGDLNINILSEPDSSQLTEAINQFGLDYLNKDIPTRHSKTTATLIDHHISCNPDSYSTIISEFPFSDHNIIVAINSQDNPLQKVKKTIKLRNKALYSKDKLIELLNETDWNEIQWYQDVNKKLEVFEKLFLCALNIVAPEKSQNVVVKTKACRMTSKKPWITNDIKTMIMAKNYRWKDYLANKTAQCHDVYKRVRNKVNKSIRKAKENYYTNEFSELHCSKKKWLFINDTLQRQNANTSIKTLSYGGRFPMSEPHDIAHHLNKTFVMMGMYQGPEIPYQSSTPKSRYHFHLSFTTSDDVRKAIKKT